MLNSVIVALQGFVVNNWKSMSCVVVAFFFGGSATGQRGRKAILGSLGFGPANGGK